MAYSGRQKGRRTVHVDVRLAGEGEVEPGEAQGTQRPGAGEALGTARFRPQERELAAEHIQRGGAPVQHRLPVQRADTAFISGDVIGAGGQIAGKIGRYLRQRLRGGRLGMDAAFLLEAVGIVPDAPGEAKAGVHRQHGAEGGERQAQSHAPTAAPRGDDAPGHIGQPQYGAEHRRQDQDLTYGERQPPTQPPQPLLRRQHGAVPQPVHGGAAGAQGEIRGKEHRQRNTPAAQGAAAHRGRALPVKHMTQWARTMILPVSSVILAEQKASLPPRRSTLPTVVRVLPAAAADR